MRTKQEPFGIRIRRHVVMMAAVLAAVIAISHQSFWIDEANAAWKAVQPSFGNWLRLMEADGGSDQQMPLYMFFLWVSEKVVGHGEWAMRALNLLWFLPGLYWFAGDRIARWLVVLASAFVWYCLDEARPYGMQIGASFLLFGATERLLRTSRETESHADAIPALDLWLLVIGLVVLAGSSLLGEVWAAAAMGAIGLALSWSPRRIRTTQVAVPIVVLLAMLALLGGYYVWTLRQGAGASTVGRTDLRNVVFIIYELLGFAGLGPGRSELRVGGLGSFRPYLVPLGLFAVCCGAVTVTGIVRTWRSVPRRTWLACASTLGGAFLLLVAAGYAKHFRLLGRHCAPLLPVAIACQAAGLTALWRGSVGRFVALLFLTLSLASAASMRFAARHAKDDYRAAAALAGQYLDRQGGVWWNADGAGARIYGLNVSRLNGRPSDDQVVLMMNPTQEFLDHLAAPDLVLCSKADVFDRHNTVRQYLEAHGYVPRIRLKAFMAYVPRTGE